MNNRFVWFSNNSSGFSLVELMVAVGIIGVLVTMATIKYGQVSRRLEVKLEAAILNKALTNLRKTTGQYTHLPSGNLNTMAHFKSGKAGLIKNDPTTPFPNWPGPQFTEEEIEELATDPWGNTYVIDCALMPPQGWDLPPAGSTGMASKGPDGVLGTDDDIGLYLGMCND